MFKEIELSEQAEQLGVIIEMLAAIAVTIREAFVHQQSRSLEDIENQYLDLNEEIAFDVVMADDLVIGKSLDDKETIFRYQKILTHLQMIDKSLKLLADALRKQMKDRILFSNKEVEQIIMLLERQENILRTLAGIVRNGEGERLDEVSYECSELAGSCLKFATSYESCLVEGLCTTESAPILLMILSRIQTLVHNEVETVRLLARWIWDRVADGPLENPAGHPS
ncbi:MAG: hypothetical protein H7Y05_09855 [Steroidobacteraceae bacterium]|nr:hypothetical protein [Deltaproteobacteria bacterium]